MVFPQFVPGGNGSRVEWREWKRSFEIYARAQEITTEQRRKDLLLSLGGPKLMSTYFLLPGSVEGTEPEFEQPYLKCVTLLDEFFAPKLNRQHEAFLLRSINQEREEKFDDFVQRIRAQIAKCDFTSEVAELMIVLQILSGAKSPETRRKILERERTVDEAITIGRNNEMLKENLTKYEPEATVQRIVRPSSSSASYIQPTRSKCFNCGRSGHLAKDYTCPARQAQCFKCGKMGHLQSVCMGKRKFEPQSRDDRNKRVRMIEKDAEPEDGETEKHFVFFLRSEKKLSFEVGGHELEMRVDSGSDISVISGKTWKKIKETAVYWDLKSTETSSCFGYEEGHPPITILCTFWTNMKFKGRQIEEKIYVAPQGNDDIIGYKASTSLEVLFVGDMNELQEDLTINQIEESQEFPKIRDYVVKLEIDASMKPIQQSYRRIPAALEGKVEAKVTELLGKDIIEKIEHPPSWLSPVVPVVKENGQLRLCVDMRKANQAVKKGFYAFASIEELIFSIEKPAKVSKIDMSNAYYLFELDPESRDITAFAVQSGNYRFKRLMFGIKSAPEEFSRGMDMLFKDVKGIIR